MKFLPAKSLLRKAFGWGGCEAYCVVGLDSMLPRLNSGSADSSRIEDGDFDRAYLLDTFKHKVTQSDKDDKARAYESDYRPSQTRIVGGIMAR